MQVSTSTGGSSAGNSKGVAVFPMGQMALFAMVIVLFFLWGMSNNLTDILVQQFKKSFECLSSRLSWFPRRTSPVMHVWRFLRLL